MSSAGNMQVMLNPPYAELGLLLRAVNGADWLAAMGCAGIGYKLLADHCREAEQAAREGCPWAREFIAAYRLAAQEYCRSLTAEPDARRAR